MSKLRYIELINWVQMIKPRSIIEIGVWDGSQATNLIQTAQQFHREIEYTGYDLFDEATAVSNEQEFNGKPNVSLDEVDQKIRSLCPTASINLIKGNTRNTLHSETADFVFIDGGHSIQTIEHDYLACSKSTTIVLDDYYLSGDLGGIVDTSKYGCNQLVDRLAMTHSAELSVGLFPCIDRSDKLGGVTMAFIVRKGAPLPYPKSRFLEEVYFNPYHQGAYVPPKIDVLIQQIYSGVLNRWPTDEEMLSATEQLSQTSIRRFVGSLINSKEFRSKL